AYLSHDLRNQLNHVSLSLQLITMRLRGKPDLAEHVSEIDSIRRSIHQTIEGMEQLLKTARLRSGHPEANLGTVNLQGLIRGLSPPFTAEARSKGIDLVTLVSPGATCISDRRLLMVILHNPLSNAVKHSDKGTIAAAVDPPQNGSWQIIISRE